MKKVVSGIVVAALAFVMAGYAEEQAAAMDTAAATPAVEKAADAAAAPVAAAVEKVADAAAPAGGCPKAAGDSKVLAMKDGKASVCPCKADCKCTLSDDGKTCSCGKDVTICELKGKCVCAKCNVVAEKAGKCACGADLKLVE